MDKPGYRPDPQRGEVVELHCFGCSHAVRAVWVRRINRHEACVIFCKGLRDTTGKPLSGIIFPRWPYGYMGWERGHQCHYRRVEE